MKAKTQPSTETGPPKEAQQSVPVLPSMTGVHLSIICSRSLCVCCVLWCKHPEGSHQQRPVLLKVGLLEAGHSLEQLQRQLTHPLGSCRGSQSIAASAAC